MPKLFLLITPIVLFLSSFLSTGVWTLTPPAATITPVRQPTPTSFPLKPESQVLPNGLTWTECEVPNRRYSHSKVDVAYLGTCMKMPVWDDADKQRQAQRVPVSRGDNLRLTIGDDRYAVNNVTTQGCCDYEYIKNDRLEFKAHAPLITFDPSRSLSNIGGKPVWELAGDPPVIYVDGEDINPKFGWDAAYLPYEIEGKLIYIARKDGLYHIVYDGVEFGPAFDRIFITYCCGYLSVTRGQGQFWFLGTRGESQYVVSIIGGQ